MRLRTITVTQLFGLFDHTIPLSQEGHITIIHGPNGYGKTAVLQMVDAALSNKLSLLRRMPFATFVLHFDDNSNIDITKSVKEPATDGRSARVSLKFLVEGQNLFKEHFEVEPITDRMPNGWPFEIIDRHLPDLQRIGPTTWLQTSSGRVLDPDDLVDEYKEFFPPQLREQQVIPQWYKDFIKQFDVRLIEAQRLFSISNVPRARNPHNRAAFEPVVNLYSKELASSIQNEQAAYGTFSQQLDSTFPNRVIQGQYSSFVGGENELKQKLADLDKKRLRIIDAGLLQKEANISPLYHPQKPIEDNIKDLLALYARDMEQKLSRFDDLTDKVELFKELINKRFSNKQLETNKENGFNIKSSTSVRLMPSDLSSGEQHELVLLYELLFHARPNSILLIDEPELSLHVAWQVEFLKDLQRVVQTSGFDCILATHSPQVINDRWDLTVQLEGPSCEKIPEC